MRAAGHGLVDDPELQIAAGQRALAGGVVAFVLARRALGPGQRDAGFAKDLDGGRLSEFQNFAGRVGVDMEASTEVTSLGGGGGCRQEGGGGEKRMA